MAARWQQYDNARHSGAKITRCTKTTLLQLYDSYLTWEIDSDQVKSEKIVFSNNDKKLHGAVFNNALR